MTAVLLPQGGDACRRAEEAFFTCLDDNGMTPLLARGVLLAFSGGADSVLLFRLLAAYTVQKKIPFAVVHVHHGIRGAEADRDADFCRKMAEQAGVPFFLLRVDVPSYLAGKGRGKSREEGARILRYEAIERLLARHQEYGTVATAHHATDNLETVLFQMMRGTGLAGIAGIPPVRDNYVRPLLYLAKRDIVEALAELGLSCVSDSTNVDLTLDRNYIREEILPRLSRLRPDPEAAITRMTKNLRAELCLREETLDGFFDAHVQGAVADRSALFSLPPALCRRAIVRLYRESGGEGMPSKTQLDAILMREKRQKKNRRYDLSGGMRAISEGDSFYIISRRFDAPCPQDGYDLPLVMGRNPIGEGGEGELWLFPERSIAFERENENIYNLFIQADLSSATMGEKLSARSRRAGDAYRTGGMTRIVRRLYSSAHLSRELRTLLPVVYDDAGILWVPGFGVRDTEKKTSKNGPYAYFCYGRKD